MCNTYLGVNYNCKLEGNRQEMIKGLMSNRRSENSISDSAITDSLYKKVEM